MLTYKFISYTLPFVAITASAQPKRQHSASPYAITKSQENATSLRPLKLAAIAGISAVAILGVGGYASYRVAKGGNKRLQNRNGNPEISEASSLSVAHEFAEEAFEKLFDSSNISILEEGLSQYSTKLDRWIEDHKTNGERLSTTASIRIDRWKKLARGILLCTSDVAAVRQNYLAVLRRKSEITTDDGIETEDNVLAQLRIQQRHFQGSAKSESILSYMEKVFQIAKKEATEWQLTYKQLAEIFARADIDQTIPADKQEEPRWYMDVLKLLSDIYSDLLAGRAPYPQPFLSEPVLLMYTNRDKAINSKIKRDLDKHVKYFRVVSSGQDYIRAQGEIVTPIAHYLVGCNPEWAREVKKRIER